MLGDFKVYTSVSNNDLLYIKKLYDNNDFSKLEKVGSGMYGVVYKYKNYAIKHILGGNKADITILNDLHHLEFIPKLYATLNDDLIISEFIEGKTIMHYKDNNFKINLDKNIGERWQSALVKIFKLGYFPYDLHDENVMICDKTLDFKIVDVGCFARNYIGIYEDYSDEEIYREIYECASAEKTQKDLVRISSPDIDKWIGDII